MRRIAINSTDNSDYAKYWPYIKKAWEKLGFEPVLIFIGTKAQAATIEGEVIQLSPIKDVPISCQAQVVRWYGCKYFPNDICLTSDVDMMPLNKGYFDAAFSSVEPETVSILSHDAYINDPGMHAYPMCYNAAMGSTFIKLLNLDPTWKKWIESLSGYNYGWQTDEAYFYNQVKESGIKVKPSDRGWNRESGEAAFRIDRNNWQYSPQKVMNNQYIDAHLPRPFNTAQGEIEKLLRFIP